MGTKGWIGRNECEFEWRKVVTFYRWGVSSSPSLFEEFDVSTSAPRGLVFYILAPQELFGVIWVRLKFSIPRWKEALEGQLVGRLNVEPGKLNVEPERSD